MAKRNDQTVREVGPSFWEEHHSDSAYQYVSERIFQTRSVGQGYDMEFSSGAPFQISSVHLALVTSGYLDMTINLIKRRYCEGQLMVATPFSIMAQDDRSDDFNMQVIQFSPEFLSEAMHGNIPPMLLHRMNDFTLDPSPLDRKAFESLSTALWDLLHADTIAEEAIGAVSGSLVDLVRTLILSSSVQLNSESSRNLSIFNRFISLVNSNCETHRDMSFYADEIGLSKQHLSTVVSAASGRTAISWIEEALLLRTMILLRHSDLTSAEISDRLSFPAPSHFTRFFKRLTGQTPLQYRKSGGEHEGQ